MIYDWPTTLDHPWMLRTADWGPMALDSTATSFLTGFTQAVGRPNTRWSLTTGFFAHSWAARAKLEGFINRLGGQEHRVRFFDPTRRVPYGTCATTGVTVASAAAQFTRTLNLAGMGATKTLLAGDKLNVTLSTGAVQCCMVAADVTSAAGGTAAVEITQQLRGSVAAASAVTLLAPTALFILKDPSFRVPYQGSNTAPEFSIDWVEVFA